MTEEVLISGTIKKDAIGGWASALVKAGYKVIAPVCSGSEVEYIEWTQGDLAFDQGLPKLSPKASWFPRTEPILKLKREGTTWTVEDPLQEYPEVVIFGARPCDARALEIQKAIFGWDFQDSFFAERSARVHFVAVACSAPLDNACFCTSVGLSPSGEVLADGVSTAPGPDKVAKGADATGKFVGDVLLTSLDANSYAAQANTETGQKILTLCGQLGEKPSVPALSKIRAQAQAAVPQSFDAQKVFRALEANSTRQIWAANGPMWEHNSEGCLACGTCAFACPTCHCFDIQDEMTGSTGLRQKNWDSCMFPLFTVHTSGHNPRATRGARWRQRVSHKFYIYPHKFGNFLCTGCGRCIRLCPGGLDLIDTLQQLEAQSQTPPPSTAPELTLNSPGVMAQTPNDSDNLYHPYPMTVAAVHDETRDVRTLRLQFANDADAEKFSLKVGQFGLYSALGEGESTFCVASSPTRTGYIECTFREAGRVTKALRRLEVGDQLGFRGPYGNSFPVDSWKGKNVVFVGGGIGVAPVRAVLQYCMDKKADFGKLTVIFGAKTWADHCYKDEMAEWEAVPNLDLYLGIDWTFGPNGPVRTKAALEGWEPLAPNRAPSHKSTGFVPELVEAVKPDPNNSVAVVCGPPIMISLAVKSLEKIGFSRDNIYATMENRMKCGIGKCGRCNVGPVYVCKEGPVFTANQLDALPADT